MAMGKKHGMLPKPASHRGSDANLPTGPEQVQHRRPMGRPARLRHWPPRRRYDGRRHAKVRVRQAAIVAKFCGLCSCQMCALSWGVLSRTSQFDNGNRLDTPEAAEPLRVRQLRPGRRSRILLTPFR